MNRETRKSAAEGSAEEGRRRLVTIRRSGVQKALTVMFEDPFSKPGGLGFATEACDQQALGLRNHDVAEVARNTTCQQVLLCATNGNDKVESRWARGQKGLFESRTHIYRVADL